MLMPATTLAQSPEMVRSDESIDVATAVEAEDTAASSTAASPAEQRKITRLSGHIQREYQVSENKAKNIVREAIRNAEQHQLDPELILAVIAVESTFKERAVSRVGARGLMQVMPGSHTRKVREIGGSQQLFDPAKNIRVGSRILVNYLNIDSGNLRRALLRYNGSLGSRSSFPDRVIRIYRDLKRITVEG
ncbi:MAG: transglycosylase SLT domain-containing protein [Candidatus Competibacteraceae bacterium]|nr:transglycosylase SLT domain-containing protein [Candidatus Competibacteraceae bacterium]MCP5126814.1 transglycosylase SLT domain-containing protein [Gammaproteobacteria bacterium]